MIWSSFGRRLVTLPDAATIKAALGISSGVTTVDNGGTGRASHTAYAVICGGITATDPQQSIAGVGTSTHVLTSNGAGALPTFQALPAAAAPFVSAQQTITAGGALTLAHGLASQPTNYAAFLQNTTAEHGYSIGNEVITNPSINASGAQDKSLSLVPDATNINVRYGAAAATFNVINKTTGAVAAATNANWRLVVRAWV